MKPACSPLSAQISSELGYYDTADYEAADLTKLGYRNQASFPASVM